MITACLRLVDWLGRFAAGLAAACLLSMSVTMLAEVVARKAFTHSLTFSWEYAGYLMGAAFFFGAAHTLRSAGHVRVSLLSEAVPAAVHRALEILVTLAGLAVTVYLVYALGLLTWTSLVREVVSFTPTQTPLAIPQGVLAVGALLLCLQMLARLVRLLRGEAPDLAPPVAHDAGTAA